MIDVNNTILKSLYNAFGKLRFQAKDDPNTFKSILELIIINDVIEWANGLDIPQSIQKQLFDKRTEFMMCNPALTLQYGQGSEAYVNVNTPQNSDTWKRVWDSSEAITTDAVFQPCYNDSCGNKYQKVTITIDNSIIE